MDWFVRIWIPIAIAVTGLCAVSFGTVQQIYRQSLNDPQVQIAEDVALQIENGGKPTAIIASSTKIDVSTSLRPYVVIYDKDLHPIVWTGILDGKPPMPSQGVFDYAKKNDKALGENRISWQPSPNVRSAIVVVHVGSSDGYVLAGRNMRETEDRIWNMQVLIGLAWIGILATTLLATWIGSRSAAGKTGIVW